MQKLNTFQLKIIGLLLMTVDHIHQYFKFLGVPIWFNWIGRVVAPIFAFTAVEGYYHTRDRKKYMTRLYLASVFMSITSIIIPNILKRPDGIMIPNNIFSTIFLITLFIKSIELIIEGKLKSERDKVKKGVLIGALPIVSSLIVVLLNRTPYLSTFSTILDIIIPNPATTEGGPVFIMIGIMMYFLRHDRTRMIIIYSFISLSILFSGKLDINTVFYKNYQWMMIFSVVFFLLYNGKKGRSMKYLFYIYYPAHIFVFYIISTLIMIQ